MPYNYGIREKNVGHLRKDSVQISFFHEAIYIVMEGRVASAWTLSMPLTLPVPRPFGHSTLPQSSLPSVPHPPIPRAIKSASIIFPNPGLSTFFLNHSYFLNVYWINSIFTGHLGKYGRIRQSFCSETTYSWKPLFQLHWPCLSL